MILICKHTIDNTIENNTMDISLIDSIRNKELDHIRNLKYNIYISLSTIWICKLILL